MSVIAMVDLKGELLIFVLTVPNMGEQIKLFRAKVTTFHKNHIMRFILRKKNFVSIFKFL